MNQKTIRLEQCCECITDGDHLPPPKADSGIPFITISNVDAYNQIDFSNSMYVPEQYYDALKSIRKVQKNDILYSVVGSFGVPVLIKDDKKFCFQRHIALLRPNDKIDCRFLYYVMKSPSFYAQADTVALGAAQRTISLSSLRSMTIQIPEIDVQRRIADILSAYDDLIENDRKQIKLLEEAAQRLYKEWFVDLRFPGWETTPIVDGLPEGWRICSLNNAIFFNPTTKASKDIIKRSVPMSSLSTSSMEIDESQVTVTLSTAGAKFMNGDTLLARITPCLENGKTAFVSFLNDGEVAVGSTEFIVMRSKSLNPYMVYCIARSDEFRQVAINSMTGADGRQRVKTDKIEVIVYQHPTQTLIDACEEKLKPIFDCIGLLDKEIIQAQQARDALLPKLMSGEIEV